jgi:glycine oxidase
MKNVLVVGFGLAGLCLCRELEKNGIPFECIDEGRQSTPSKVSSGLINPITGRRFQLAWNYSQLFRVFEPFYRDLEERCGAHFFNEIEIIHPFTSIEVQNNFAISALDPLHEDYLSVNDKIHSWPITEEFGIIKNGFRLDLRRMIEAYSKILKHSKILRIEKFDYEQLHIEEKSFKYQNREFTEIVFCEGPGIASNPFFKNIPLVPAKGEVLIIQVEGLDEAMILKKDLYFMRISPNTYWVGSNYQWDYEDSKPTAAKQEEFYQRITSVLPGYKIKVLEHWAAIRPSSHDRKPYIGRHKIHVNMMIINGLGTKGCSLSPYLAQEAVRLILQNDYIVDRDINLERGVEFAKKRAQKI